MPRASTQRAFYVRRRDVERYHATVGCRACQELISGMARTAAHTDACRERIMQCMRDAGGDLRFWMAEYEQRGVRRDQSTVAPEPEPYGEGNLDESEERVQRAFKRLRLADPEINLDDYRYATKRKVFVADAEEDAEIIESKVLRRTTVETEGTEGGGGGVEGSSSRVEQQPPSSKWLAQHEHLLHPHAELDLQWSYDGEVDAWDDVHGGFLPLYEVKIARAWELSWMRRAQVYKKVPIEEADGEKIVTVKWIDTDKSGGDPDKRFVHSRLVARDIKP
eukprot:689876-Amphidinium_carterae.2